MKKFEIASSVFALVLGTFATFSSAAQIQGFVSSYAPGDIKVTKTANGVDSDLTLHSDFIFGLGAEFLAFPAGPLMVGGGLGFFSEQKDGDADVMMPSIPLWGSIGVIGPDSWKVRPYLEARVGYPIPASQYKTWWNKPLNFFVTGTVGVQLPYHMGIEFDCTYLTMDKYFKAEDVNFRMNAVKLGGSITVHFDLSKNTAASSEVPAENKSAVTESASEDYFNEISSSAVNEFAESSSSEESYRDYSEQPTEQPVENSVAEETAADPAETTAESVEDSSEATSDVVDSSEETSADEIAESAVEETESAETETAVEAVKEPEPAPEMKAAPEVKPAAKKVVKKKTSKKTTKKSKKSSKKSKAKKKK